MTTPLLSLMEDEPPTKRRRVGPSAPLKSEGHAQGNIDLEASRSYSTNRLDTSETTRDLSSLLNRPISPPHSKRYLGKENVSPSSAPNISSSAVASPLRLSHVEGLSSANNVDTLRLKDIIGDPLIKECWVFNYLFDVDFLM